MSTTEHLDIRPAPGFREAVLACARELVALGERFGPLKDYAGLTVKVYVGCRPSKTTLLSLAPIAELDGAEVWVGNGEPLP
ncbi:MAG: hypothetical protein IPP83_13525 [Flavobacteriales bacterium]|nr:hypothetical protein [Flavobacteriales bacterium]